MITRMPRSCGTHRAALLDFVDRQERTPATAGALAHLERCRACEDELAGIVRTVAALRRLGEAVARAEPAAEAWPRLRDRVGRPNPAAWRWRLSLGGLMMSTAAVALLTIGGIVPGPLPGSTRFTDGAGATSSVDRRYDSPPGLLTVGMIDAIAGTDVSRLARLRSSEFHISPSSVDRDERDRGGNAVVRPDRAVLPTAVARS